MNANAFVLISFAHQSVILNPFRDHTHGYTRQLETYVRKCMVLDSSFHKYVSQCDRIFGDSCKITTIL